MSSDKNHPDPSELDEQLEVGAGRRAPFTQLGDWVALSGISSHAKALYWHLSMHLNMERGDFEVWPSRAALAEWLGIKKVAGIDRYLDELTQLGAIETHRRRYMGGMRARNRYIIHQTPPDGYTGPRSLSEWYTTRRAELSQQGGVSAARPVVPSEGPREQAQTNSVFAARPVVPSKEPPESRTRDLGSPVQGTSVVPSEGLERDEGEEDEGKPDQPPPAPASSQLVDIAPPEEEDKSDGTTRAARDLLTSLPDPWRLGPKSADRLAPLAASALRDGWDPDQLAEHLASNPYGVRHPESCLRSRLADLPPPPAAREAPQPRRPAHCGQCHETTRMIEPEHPREPPYPCPQCHPMKASA